MDGMEVPQKKIKNRTEREKRTEILVLNMYSDELKKGL